jgi:hypothetical protein
MHSLRVIFAGLVAAALGSEAARAQSVLRGQGEEGEPNRRQQWLVPSPDPARAVHAFQFRPPQLPGYAGASPGLRCWTIDGGFERGGGRFA